MIRKTMRVGDVRTSIKLEPEYWAYLKETADGRSMRLSALVNEVADTTPDRTNLASTLRTYALLHAQKRSQNAQGELDRLSLAGNGQDLMRVLETCPLPALVLDSERAIKHINRAFTQWLNLDIKATLGQRLDNIMILRGSNMREMWLNLADGRLARGTFNATYVSPGKVRTAQALALSVGSVSGEARRGFIVMFETLSGRP